LIKLHPSDCLIIPLYCKTLT